MSKAAVDRQMSLECTPVRRRSGTSPEGEGGVTWGKSLLIFL